MKKPIKCEKAAEEWLFSEYKEPKVDWSKVEVDTPILVRDSKDVGWKPRYFAKYENGNVYTWVNGCTSWSAKSDDYMCSWEQDYAKLAESEEQVIRWQLLIQ